MISVIIASVNKKMLDDLSKNIRETIGVPFEILAYENSSGQRGICQIYNQGAREAKYDLLCFSHEDIHIKTENWGEIIRRLFTEHNRLGLLGVVGSSYKSQVPSGWGSADNYKKTTFSNYIQSYKHRPLQDELIRNNPTNAVLQEVVCVDGFWMVTRKSVALENPFSEDLLRGFHGYDIDFSLQVGSRHMVAVTFEILMQHFSEGSFDKNWLSDTLLLHEKWNDQLPRSINPIQGDRELLTTKRAFKILIKLFYRYGKSLHHVLAFLSVYRRKNGLPAGLYAKLLFYVFKYRFKHK